MKRLFTSALCALTLLTLAACGGGEAERTPAPAPTPTMETVARPTPTPDAEPIARPTPTPTAMPAPVPTPKSTPVALPLSTPAVVVGDEWLACTDGTEVGKEKPAALSEAEVGGGVLSLCFVPLPTEEGISAFRDSATQPPLVDVSYNADYGVLFVTLHDTALKSGEPQSGEEDWVYDYVRELGLTYPYSVATGSLGEDNEFFTKPAISSNGTDVTITLMLTDKAVEYRVETGHRAAEMFPTVEISFRAAE